MGAREGQGEKCRFVSHGRKNTSSGRGRDEREPRTKGRKPGTCRGHAARAEDGGETGRSGGSRGGARGSNQKGVGRRERVGGC